MRDAAAEYVRNTGDEFADEDVVAAYAFRTDYPAKLYERLLALSPGRDCMLELGCVPGQLARHLAPHFADVLAVDPSAAMLRLAASLSGGDASNIRWDSKKAEDVVLETPVDLVVAAASIHWMDPTCLFPKLVSALKPQGVMAIVGGDGPVHAAWIEAWQAVIIDWVGRMGGVWDGTEHRNRIEAHQPWFDVVGRETFLAPVMQAVEELIEAEHSRATWARAKMGDRAMAFDADLRAAVTPYAQGGYVEFQVSSTLAWGRPRIMPNHP